MLTYIIPVLFLFSLILGFRLGLKIGLALGFGFGNLTGGAAGTVDPCGRKTPFSQDVFLKSVSANSHAAIRTSVNANSGHIIRQLQMYYYAIRPDVTGDP